MYLMALEHATRAGTEHAFSFRRWATLCDLPRKHTHVMLKLFKPLAGHACVVCSQRSLARD